MSIFLWILTSILMFSMIVLVHEFWHFQSARFFGVKVEEFWLWIPPRVKKLWKDKKWTLFSLNLLPIGGFVKLKWENQIQLHLYDGHKQVLSHEQILETIHKNWALYDDEGKKISIIEIELIKKKLKGASEDDNLFLKPYWQQGIIILAGVMMNFLLAISIFTILFYVWVKPVWINDKISTNLDVKLVPTFEQAISKGILVKKEWLRMSPIKDSIAEKSWMKENDLVIEINWKVVETPQDFIQQISQSPWKSVTLDILRDSKRMQVTLIPNSEWKIWSYIWNNIEYNENFIYQYPLPIALQMGIEETYKESILTGKGLFLLVKHIFSPTTVVERKEALDSVAWPIGIVKIVSQSVSRGFSLICILAAMISINLWVFNLLPIPALDGWRFLFIIINTLTHSIFKKRWISLRWESYFHTLFFLTLIALSIIIWYNDIIKLLGHNG